MKAILTLFIPLILFCSQAHAHPQWFADLYTEGNYLSGSDNAVGFAHLRAGQRFDQLEFYGAIRGSTDTRSDDSPLGQVYNDNFIFVGVGADYISSFVKGFRLRAQIGESFNLLDRPAQKQGFDFQTGLLTYHEGPLGSGQFSFENYGEALYIHRYQNLLLDNQFRVLYRHFETKKGTTIFGAFPVAMAVLGFDANEVYYNRFIDLRMGIRFQAREANWVASLTPEFVTGKYIIQKHQAFHEFRLLAVFYSAFF